MSTPAINAERVRMLAAAVCDDTASRDELFELDTALRADERLRKSYVKYCQLHVSLETEMRAGLALRRAQGRNDLDSAVLTPWEADILEATMRPAVPVVPYVPTFSSTTFHSTVSFLSSGWPLAYLAATVILAVGCLVAHLTPHSRQVRVARTPPARSRSLPEPATQFAGQVTGMVDCRWVNKETEPALGTSVPLGRKFTMASGLMEITYNTGAKVVLQGPVTYEVESKNGGFLPLGKLTGKVEAEAAKGFVVRTPTAIMTDLSTEFGVEVSKTGDTTSYVFLGSVAVQSVARDGRCGSEVRLHENQSVQVGNDADGRALTVRPVKVDPARFVRAGQLPKMADALRLKPFQHWLAYSQELRRDPSLLAYYDFQQRTGQPAVLPNVAASSGRLLDGVVENAIWSTGRMPGKHGLLFNSPTDYVSINLPQKTDDLTLAAWVNVESLQNPSCISGLLMSDQWKQNGLVHWQVGYDGGEGRVGFDVCGSSGRSTASISAPLFNSSRLFRWTHLALVYDHIATCVRFYADGNPLGAPRIVKHEPISIGTARIGHWNFGSYVGGEGMRNFRGRIDELAIFGRPLRAEEIKRMFEAGSVSTKGVGQ
jgi:hypothetical protein